MQNINAATEIIGRLVNWKEIKENHRLLLPYVIEAVYDVKDKEFAQLCHLLLADEQEKRP